MLTPGTSIGKYVVRRKLAEGGMAEIYLCCLHGAAGFEKDVVIKRIRPLFAAEKAFTEMFFAEARLASRLNHANVVQIFDFDMHEGAHYLAMEYVRGVSLADLFLRCREMQVPVPPPLATQIAISVARGLRHAHKLAEGGQQIGLVHRDVTPHNVLLSFDGAVKLTDFGIAKVGGGHTAPGVLKGKFAYMSPEQARGEKVDARTDLFALGVVLWEALTGARLFQGDSDVAVLQAVQQRTIARPSSLNPAVGPELDAAVMKGLERDAAARFQTARLFEQALAESLLRSARSIEDTDVGAFVQRLFAELKDPGSAAPPDASIEAPRSSGSSLPDTKLSRRPSRKEAQTQALLPRGGAALLAGLGIAAALGGAAAWVRGRPVAGPDPASVRLLGVAAASSAGADARAGAPVAQSGPAEPPAVTAARFDAEVPPATGPVPTEAAPGAAKSPPMGTLVLNVSPWADVVLDGRAYEGIAGLRSFKLPPGKHRVRFAHPNGDRDVVVTVEPDKSTTQEFNAFK